MRAVEAGGIAGGGGHVALGLRVLLGLHGNQPALAQVAGAGEVALGLGQRFLGLRQLCIQLRHFQRGQQLAGAHRLAGFHAQLAEDAAGLEGQRQLLAGAHQAAGGNDVGAGGGADGAEAHRLAGGQGRVFLAAGGQQQGDGEEEQGETGHDGFPGA